jgi:hypothetical protein
LDSEAQPTDEAQPPDETLRQAWTITLFKALEILASAVVVGIFAYFAICFAFVYTISINLDRSMLFYVSFQDYLRAGLFPNISVAVIIMITVLLIYTGLQNFRSSKSEHESFFLIEFVKTLAQTRLPMIIVLMMIVETFLITNPEQSGFVKAAASWLFWVSAALAFALAMTRLRLPFSYSYKYFLAIYNSEHISWYINR